MFDAGEGDPSYSTTLRAGMQQAGCKYLSQIIVSHWHHDHLGGVPQVLALHLGQHGTNAVPVRKYMPSTDPKSFGTGESAIDPYTFFPKEKFIPIQHGETISDAGVHLRMLFTPGHANDHCVAVLQEENAMFTADNVLGVGTSVFNDLHDYMHSLKVMLANAPGTLYPGHGPSIQDGCGTIAAYIEHRLKRVVQAVEMLATTPTGETAVLDWNLETLTRAMYIDLDERLIPPAMGNTYQVLESLLKDGIVDRQGRGDPRRDGWKLIVPVDVAVTQIKKNASSSKM